MLRPGGRLYVDNFNLCSDEGWEFFLKNASIPPLERPSNISKSSTPDELRAFIDAVIQDKPTPVTGLDGRAPVVMALAARKSYLEGRPVRLDEIEVRMRHAE